MKRNIIKILLVSLAMLTACNQGPTKNEKFKLLYNYYHAAVVEQGETPLSYDEWITYNNIDETKEFETRVNGEQVEWKYTTEDDTKWRPVVIITKKCDHAWDDGVVTIEPTCISQGEKEYTCSKCSEKKLNLSLLIHMLTNMKKVSVFIVEILKFS